VRVKVDTQSTRRARRRRQSNEVEAGGRKRQRQPAHQHALWHRPHVAVQATGQLYEAAASGPFSLPTATADDPLRRARRVIGQRGKRQVAAWCKTSAESYLRSPATRHQHHRGRVDASRKNCSPRSLELRAGVKHQRDVRPVGPTSRVVEDVAISPDSWRSPCGAGVLFLREHSGHLIPTVELPMSIIGTFRSITCFGYSLDNISLGWR